MTDSLETDGTTPSLRLPNLTLRAAISRPQVSQPALDRPRPFTRQVFVEHLHVPRAVLGSGIQQ